MGTRILAQHIRTGEWLNKDVPSSDVSVKHTLSGPDVISGKFTPELPNLNIGLFDEWSTWLYVEQDGQIRGSGIIQPHGINDSSSNTEVQISADGASSYPHGIPFSGEISEFQVDPLDIVRRIWSTVQSHPDGNLGVQIDDTTSPIRIGTHKDPDDDLSQDEPYKLNWWEHKDCGQEINNLAKQTPFDYRDISEWNTGHTDVIHRFEIGYPRLGHMRNDLRFAEGENIISSVPLTEIDGLYASEVEVLGAGQGRDMIRGRVGSPSETRLRRVAVVTDKSITTTDRATKRARDELKRRQADVSMKQITVSARHLNAQLGTFQCGDDIPVTGEFPWIGRTCIWHRITSYTWKPNSDSVQIDLKPSSSFRYGPFSKMLPLVWKLGDSELSYLGQTTILG